MGARILYRDSQGRDGAVDLTPSAPVYVGRALDCAIRTDDAMVSRKHSMIRMERDEFFVEDLGSSNGTHVNDVRVTKQPLKHNDVVRCGSLWLRYVEDGPVADEGPIPGPGPGAGPVPSPAGKRGGATGQYGVGASGRPIKSPTYPPPNGAVSGTTGDAPGDAVNEVGESSVVVDLNAEGPERVNQLLESARSELEELQGRFDREAAEGKRIKAESITLRDRIDELKRNIQDREDMIASHSRVAEELRDELKQTRDELVNLRAELAEAQENVAARDRQMERAGADVLRLKEEIEDYTKQLADVSRTKDEGWKKLNDQLGEIEHLREVINEQERMLEERRVGLVSQEAVIKELRNDKNGLVEKTAGLRAERDELRADTGRHLAQIEAIDEENKRLSGLLAQLRTKAGRAQEQDTIVLAEELKLARIEARKLGSDRERLQEMYDRAESEIQRLESKLAELEVEVRDAYEKRDVASSSRTVAEEAMAKAEARAHGAEEAALEAARARDDVLSVAEEARREADRMRREIDRARGGGSSEGEVDGLVAELDEARQKLREALNRANDAERQLGTLKAERDAAQKEVHGFKTGAFQLEVVEADDAVTSPGAPIVDDRVSAIEERAMSVYGDINDILSELRNNLRLASAEFGDLSGNIEGQKTESVRIIKEALDSLLGNAEDAKGILRSLKELVEFDA